MDRRLVYCSCNAYPVYHLFNTTSDLVADFCFSTAGLAAARAGVLVAEAGTLATFSELAFFAAGTTLVLLSTFLLV